MAVSLPSARPSRRACPIPGTVDVWRIDLRRTGEDRLEGLLCGRERARAAEIVDRRRRALWMRSRGALRLLLARYLEGDPRELMLEYGAHGKPRLRERAGRGQSQRSAGPSEASPDLRFNLSHSGELMLLAVTDGREVGVDVERVRERRTAEFLRAWTAREALAKCLGAGLIGGTVTAEEQTQPKLWTTILDVGPGAFAALAVEGSGKCELRLRDAPPKLGV